MKKSTKAIIAVIVLFILGVATYFGYIAYEEYKFNKELKSIISSEKEKGEEEVRASYENLLKKHEDKEKTYIAYSNFYISKGKLNNAIEVIYRGLDKNEKSKNLKELIKTNIDKLNLRNKHITSTKGEKLNLSKLDFNDKSGQKVELKFSKDSVIELSKEGLMEVELNEKYTDKVFKVRIEVLKYRGNTLGNISQGGFMAYKDGWIYFRDVKDEKLYKMKEDFSEKTLLDGKVKPSYICIKDDNLYFIDENSGEYSSLIKMDLNGKYKEVLRQNTSYVDIIEDNIYYTKVVGENNGWLHCSLNMMNLKGKDIKNNIITSQGYLGVIDDKYMYTNNKFATLIFKGEGPYLWGDTGSDYKFFSPMGVFHGTLYGNMTIGSNFNEGFGDIDIENNRENIILNNVETSNILNGEVYYVTSGEVKRYSIGEKIEDKLMNTNMQESRIYVLGNEAYLYSTKSSQIVKIKNEEKDILKNTNSNVEKDNKDNNKEEVKNNQETKKNKDDKKNEEVATNKNSNLVPDLKNEDIINMGNEANKLLLEILLSRTGEETFTEDGIMYLKMKKPYESKENIRKALEKYFTKDYIQDYMKKGGYKEKKGYLFVGAGDVGEGAGYKYNTVKSRTNKEGTIEVVSYAGNDVSGEAAPDGEIILKLEDGQWKIQKFHSIFQ